MEPESDFEVLKDKHVGDTADDFFGYRDIAQNLLSIICKAEPPFTIGLYGQWGLGKSSVCGLVQKSLENSKEYEVFYFDTWKYERDSFRRQFLIELDQEVFKGALEHRKLLNQSLTVPSVLPFFESLRKSADYFIRRILTTTFLPFVIGLLGLGIALLINAFVWQFVSGDIVSLLKDGVSGVLILGTLIFIVKFIIESVKVIEAEITIPRTDSAEGFEHYYGKALQKLPGKKKLLVIIDNLDRLDHANGVALLSDIKTFLANEKLDRTIQNRTVFLIPCDDSALADQIRGVYKDKVDADEFLRKFFNVSIRLPRLVDSALDGFIEKKLTATKVPEFKNNHSLTFVIGRAFRNNPREIIQFINTLTATYLLAKTRGLGNITSKANVPFLAKVLAIRVKWSNFYKTIEEQVIRTSETLEMAARAIPDNGDYKSEKYNLHRFIDATTDIRDEVNGDEVYFSLYQSDEQKILPEWPAFLSAALDARVIDLRKVYESIKETSEKKAALQRLLMAYYTTNAGRHDNVIGILRSLHHIFNEDNLPVFEPFVARAYNNPDTLVKHFGSIPFDHLLSSRTFSELEIQTQRNVASSLLKAIEIIGAKNESDGETLHQSIVYLGMLSEAHLEETLSSFYPEIVRVKSVILSKIDINQVSPDKDEDDFITNFLELFNSKTPLGRPMLFPGLYQLFILIQHSSFTDKKYIQQVLHVADKFLEKVPVPDSIPAQEDKDRISQFTSQTVVHYNATDDWLGLRKSAARVLLNLWSNDNPQVGIIQQSLTDFISNGANDSVENILDAFGKDDLIDLMKVKPPIATAVAQRTRVNPELYYKLGLTPDSFKESEFTDVLRSLESSRDGFIEMMKHIKYSLTEPQKVALLRAMSNSLEHLDDKQLQEWLDVAVKLGMLEEVKERFSERLKFIVQRNENGKDVVKKFLAKHKKFATPEDMAVIDSIS